MDAKLKAEWVKALRSGEYRQGLGKLQDGNSFCCLGVLCRVAGVPIGADGYSQDDYATVRRMLGDKVEPAVLWTMNDHARPFPEIADYIEANL